MEPNAGTVEENPAPNSTGPLIQISSIYIDLKFPAEKNETESSCQHTFTIRGYTAEMRKKNPQACMPFASSDADLKGAEVEFASMDLPSFKVWNCTQCQRRIFNRNATEETTDHCNCSTSLNVANGDPTTVASGSQQVPASQTNDKSIHDETGGAAVAGNSGAVEPVSDKSVGVSGNESATEAGNIVSSDDGSVEVSAPVAVNSTVVAAFQAEGRGNASSETDQKKHDNPSGATRRKRKLRYLTDLLGDNRNIKDNHPRPDDSSVYMLVASSGPRIVVPKGQAPFVDVCKVLQKADSDRTVKDIAISSSEWPVNASSGCKSDFPKRKTEKTTGPAKRKNKKIQVQDTVSPRHGEQSFGKTDVKESDQQAVTANTSTRSLGISSVAGKTDSCSGNSESPQVPEMEQSNCTQTSPQNSKSQSSDQEVGIDLSQNKLPEKIDSLSTKEKPSSSVVENNDIPCGRHSILPVPEPDIQKNSQLLDLNQNSVVLEKRILQQEISCHKEKSSEVPVCPKEVNTQSDQISSNGIARGSSDDIPMEIVELMAKNQYERGLADAGNQSFPHRMSNSMRRFPAVQGMGPTSQFAKGIPGLTTIAPVNARQRIGIGVAHAGTEKGNPISYSQMNRNHFQGHRPELNKVSVYNILPHQQDFSRIMQYPDSATFSSGSQYTERAETSSLSKALNISFGLGMHQKYPAQDPELLHKGKTISDIKADELKKTQQAQIILSKPGSSELSIKPKGPVDPYANESIPAMQLLSLMDGRSSGSTFNMGSSKPFAQCSYHPRYGTTEKRAFLSGSPFQRQAQLLTSVGETSVQSSGRHPFAFSGQPQERDQSYLARYTGCIPFIGQTCQQGKDKQKAPIGSSDSTPYIQQYLGRRLLSQNGVCIAQEVQPTRIIPREEQTCATNLNPAEYFLPDDAENDFTIWGEKLKFQKRRYSREITRDRAKRQRIAKPKPTKEQPQNPSP